jgi:hypothetical protein
MAALHTLTPIGLFFRHTAANTAPRRTAPRPRYHVGIATSIWAAIGPVIACLWALLAVGFSLLVLGALLGG